MPTLLKGSDSPCTRGQAGSAVAAWLRVSRLPVGEGSGLSFTGTE